MMDAVKMANNIFYFFENSLWAVSTRSVLYENLSERYYLVQRHILSKNLVIDS